MAGSSDLAVTISSPTKKGDGISSFITYQVHTKTSLPQYMHGEFTVTRRFRDFDWLHTQLVNKHPGTIVPALPEKQDMKNVSLRLSGVGMSAEALEQRRAGLQRFIHRVAKHPHLHKAQDLQTFLEATDQTLEAWKASSKGDEKSSSYLPSASSVKEGSSSLVSGFKSYLSSDAAPATFEPEQDGELQQMKNYADTLQMQLQAVHKHSKGYVEKHKALSSSMADFSLALSQLGSGQQQGLEEGSADEEALKNEKMGKAIEQMGLTIGRLGQMFTELSEAETASFEEPMHEYVRLLSSCKQAIGKRKGALEAYNKAKETLATKKAKVEKVKDEKRAAAEREATEAEEQERVAKEHYEKVKKVLSAEFRRFQTEKLADFKKLVVQFVSLQIDHSQRVQAQWRELLPTLEAIDPP